MQGRTVVLVDDMADTCYTLLNAVNQLIRNLQIRIADFFVWGGGGWGVINIEIAGRKRNTD